MVGKSCCEGKAAEIEKMVKSQRKVLLSVMLINAVMFVCEFSFGIISRSSSLLADSLDMFGDATVYAFSLFVLSRGKLWRARAGLLKGAFMILMGVFVLAQTAYRLHQGVSPVGETMGWVALTALAANSVCLLLLYRHRSDDVNMRSTWLCSRNDIIANVGVLVAAALVVQTQSIWPDTVVGLLIAWVFVKSSVSVISESLAEIGLAKAERAV